jgi:hypothetical protein
VLGLYPSFDYVQWTRYHACHASCRCACEDFQSYSDISLANPCLCHFLLLFVECELEGGEWKVADESGFVAVKQGREAFETVYGAHCVDGTAVVVATVEVGVIVAALELETSLEDFGWNVKRRSCQISQKAFKVERVSNRPSRRGR